MSQRHIRIMSKTVYEVVDTETGQVLLTTEDHEEASAVREDGLVCQEFNVSRQGMCKRPLDERGECPEQALHGDEFEERR